MFTKHRQRRRKYKQSDGLIRRSLFLVIVCIIVLAAFRVFEIVNQQTPSAIPEIESGVAGLCLDDHRDSHAANATVDSWTCNGTPAQDWSVSDNTIKHDNKYCLSVANNGNKAGDKIVSAVCNGEAGQVWVSAIDGYENPTSALCLNDPSGNNKAQLILSSCNGLTTPREAWMPAIWSKTNKGASLGCRGTEEQLVACYAAKQLVLWQSGSVSHSSLLNQYSDGNGYEEWCADFVSYIYKQAGYPFIYGERNGWDEYVAADVQYENFAYHPAAGYTPQTGDIAYFDYPGGHVEIVAVGGPKPLFIYGDSAKIDPSTGNGEMAENTITNDGSLGQVMYYLSPLQGS